MIYSVNFMDMAGKINPLAFSRYLTETGWKLYPSKRDYIKVFQWQENKVFYQVIIPLEKNLYDYCQAMYTSVETVARKENRSVEQVMLYLLNPNTDILKIRLEKKDMEPGNILFDDAIRLYENAKKLLAAAALDVINPKAYHHGRLDEPVSRFLNDCRFGQTEIGSYLVSIVCPFAILDEKNKYQPLSIFSDEADCEFSLTRKVTAKVMKNLFIIKTHIDDGNLQALGNLNGEDTISANFYDALNGLDLQNPDTGLEFTAEWSPVVRKPDQLKSSIFITHDYSQPISVVSDKLKANVRQNLKIIGRVKKLESSPDIETRTKGRVTLIYLSSSNKLKNMTIELDKADYDKAIKAHLDGLYVEVCGEMIAGKRVTEMDCHSFNIIEY